MKKAPEAAPKGNAKRGFGAKRASPFAYGPMRKQGGKK